MTVKIEIKSVSGKLLFEFEKENNSIKEALKEASLQGANLRGAYLQGAYLEGAYLQGVYLQRANLKGAYLQGANLKGANLQGAYLEGANLQGANLEGANLQGSNLKGANLKGAYLPMFSKWSMVKKENDIFRIGCKEKTFEEWDLFFASESEFETKRGSDDFIRIQAMYLANKAYYSFLNEHSRDK